MAYAGHAREEEAGAVELLQLAAASTKNGVLGQGTKEIMIRELIKQFNVCWHVVKGAVAWRPVASNMSAPK